MALQRPDTGNYFVFYGLPVTFRIDPGLLKQKFLDMSRQYHPDFYGDDPEAQNVALAVTAFNNKAYKILGNDISRAQYLVELNGMGEDKYVLPQDFLMDMMELNEAIDELSDESRPALISQVNAMRENLQEQIRKNAEEAQWQDTQIAVLKWRYLERLEQRLR